MASTKKQTRDSGTAGAIAHAATELPLVTLDSYNLELRAGEGFLGDRANKAAFWTILNDWRERLREADEDPIADLPKKKVSKKTLETLLVEGAGEQAGLVMGAIEDFARELAGVIKRFLRHDDWRGTERIVVGGGMRGGRLGEMMIGRTGVLLKGEGVPVDLVPISHDPDEAGLIGASQLMPSWMFKGHDALLAVDIGGTNIRTGVVELKFDRSGRLKDARVRDCQVWKHAEEAPSRKAAVTRIIEMLESAVRDSHERRLRLAPLIGVGCPGVIRADGSIERGGQNLPRGNWESERFNLPRLIREAVPTIAGEETHVVMHNDAVVQGLSEAPNMTDAQRWGVLTIGTGLGNARFSNRPPVARE
ncbi:MAG: ROK family protein [Beijerinckiaceae bacterium]